MRFFFLLGMGESCPGAQQNTLLKSKDEQMLYLTSFKTAPDLLNN